MYLEYVNSILPRNEMMGKALRKDMPMYPELVDIRLAILFYMHIVIVFCIK